MSFFERLQDLTPGKCSQAFRNDDRAHSSTGPSHTSKAHTMSLAHRRLSVTIFEWVLNKDGSHNSYTKADAPTRNVKQVSARKLLEVSVRDTDIEACITDLHLPLPQPSPSQRGKRVRETICC